MIEAMLIPEWRLAGEVLRQALEDAQGQPGVAPPNVQEIDEARRFCVDQDGPWAEARVLWCDAGSIVAGFFQATAARALSGAQS